MCYSTVHREYLEIRTSTKVPGEHPGGWNYSVGCFGVASIFALVWCYLVLTMFLDSCCNRRRPLYSLQARRPRRKSVECVRSYPAGQTGTCDGST